MASQAPTALTEVACSRTTSANASPRKSPNLIGEDVGSLSEVVQSTLNGSSTGDITSLLGSDAVSGLFADDSGALTDTLGGVLEGKSPEEIANLISTANAAGGVIPRNST